MPEARQGMSQGQETMRDITGAFWISRAAYPVGVAAPRSRHVQNLVATTDNKENIPPSGAVTARRRARTRKSPLPRWYPRTPLRDITVIVNALERRRMRARAAQAQQRSPNPGASSITSPVADEMNVSDHAPVGQALPSDVSDTSPSPAVASYSSNSAIEYPLHTPPSPTTFFPQELPSCPVSISASPLKTEDLKPTEFEKKLQSTIAEMERLVLENLKRSPKPPAKKATRTLMSMR